MANMIPALDIKCATVNSACRFAGVFGLVPFVLFSPHILGI